MKDLEYVADGLSTQNNELKRYLTKLEIEKTNLIEIGERRDERIMTLEGQLTETHQKILSG
jgi:hypothetical protein